MIAPLIVEATETTIIIVVRIGFLAVLLQAFLRRIWTTGRVEGHTTPRCGHVLLEKAGGDSQLGHHTDSFMIVYH